eukprot:c20238_g1_i1 orf=614-2218(+)
MEIVSREVVSDSSTGTLVLGAAVIFFSYLYVYRLMQRKKKGPKSWPLLGASIEQLRNFERMHDWLVEYFEKAKTFCVPMPGFNYTYTVDPTNVEYILKTNFSNFPKGKEFRDKMEPLLGEGIFNADGELWRQQRKTASFEFATKLLRDYSTVVFRQYALKLAYILSGAAQRKDSVDLHDLFMRLTLDSICKVGFGIELGILSPHLPEVPFAKAFDSGNEIVTLRFIDPFWKVKRCLGIGYEAALKQSIKIVDDFTYKVIQTRKGEMEATEETGKQQIMKPDLLSRFIVLSKDPENSLDDKCLRDVVLNFVIAGRDTTAATLSWFIYMISTHPNVAETIYEELCTFEKQYLGREDHLTTDTSVELDAEESFKNQLADFATLLTFDSLANLQYLHAAITETLRLYPAVPEDPKGVLDNDILPDGTKLKKGTMVTYSPYSMGRMAYIWGPDSREYKPERWFSNGVFQNVSPFKFTAFQAGPRICLGKDSAYLQMKMTAATLCRFFKFDVVPGHVVKYRMMAILSMNGGLKVNVSRRP